LASLIVVVGLRRADAYYYRMMQVSSLLFKRLQGSDE
jgi:hypothetical protein